MSVSEQLTITAIATVVTLLVSALWTLFLRQFRAIRNGLEYSIERQHDVAALQHETNQRLDRMNGNLRTHDQLIVDANTKVAHLEGQIDGIMRIIGRKEEG